MLAKAACSLLTAAMTKLDPRQQWPVRRNHRNPTLRRDRPVTLLKSQSAKKTGVLGWATAAEFLVPTNVEIEPATAMTGYGKSAQPNASPRPSGYAALPTDTAENW